jgi:hypothetical protein
MILQDWNQAFQITFSTSCSRLIFSCWTTWNPCLFLDEPPLDFLAEVFFEPTLDLLAEEDLPLLNYWQCELLLPPPLPLPVDRPTGFRAPSKNGDLGFSEALIRLPRLGRSPD